MYEKDGYIVIFGEIDKESPRLRGRQQQKHHVILRSHGKHLRKGNVKNLRKTEYAYRLESANVGRGLS